MLRRDTRFAIRDALDCVAILALPSLNIYRRRKAIAEFSAEQRIPTMSGWRDLAVDGNLMTYGPNLDEAWRTAATYVDQPDLFRQSAAYVDRILEGAKPGDLPVQNPTKFELVFNLKTAKALGVTIPPSLLNIADEVIE